MRALRHCAAAALLFLHGLAVQAMDRVAFPALDGKVELSAYWFPASASGPRPTVISLHGCGGALTEQQKLSPAYFRDAGYFNAERMHLLVVDSFSPRGVKSICEIARERRTVSEEDRRDDVFAAIR
ncbi:hypothetical protein [Noviherbaspirillum denitrificans]|uniref:Dienelactone hydrolase domain-containing protein n=1 Tax=Noviherbaspirillum denitrificans TaxID=1968433 RepID=A0A254T8L5_9BURK|nr:hypothetical protein [Noviherbaspirillum denitrificans]OWW18925.1 hypothetical protein AYR66_04925 [Noviherbaspirillum denitrificans]